jgi:hypothetical protein
VTRLPSLRSRRASILTIAALVAAALTAAPATAAAPSAGATYQFSAMPGTAAWAAFTTHKQMREATQIPQKTAEGMTTESLVDLALRYPLLPDALAFSSVQYGFETVASRFNGLGELMKREDSGTVLLRRYRTASAAIARNATELQAGDHALALWKLETLLAQPQVLATMTPAQLTALMRAGEAKFTAKQANASVYGEAGLEPTATLLGRALATREGWSWKGSGLLTDGIALVPGAAEGILAIVRLHFLEPAATHAILSDEQAARAGGRDISPMDYASTVYTPRGSAVGVTTMTTELSSATITSHNNYVATNYPSATRETNASRKYNCHSYAWYSTSTANDRWMNTPGDNRYWEDGSYTFWHPPYIWFSNMKLSWGQDDHSGIRVGTGSYVRSKWGQLPRMYHTAPYSPYNEGTAPPPYTIGQGLNSFFLT